MTTNVASSAVETATQTAASTGGSIGLTVFKLAVIAAICGLVYTMLKKKGGSPGSSGTAVEVLRNLCNAVSEPAAPQKEEAFGNYILNVLDRDNERTVIELNDKHLTAGSGEYIGICWKWPGGAVKDPMINQVIELKNYPLCSLAAKLTVTDEPPIVVFRGKSGKLYMRVRPDLVCEVEGGDGRMCRINTEKHDFAFDLIAKYKEERLLFVEGCPVYISVNRSRMEPNGTCRKMKIIHNDESIFKIKEAPVKNDAKKNHDYQERE